MNVLIFGSGGREHALGWKIRQSKACKNIFFMPGNAGTLTIGASLQAPASAHELIKIIELHQIDLTVFGPEVPLAQGWADLLRSAGKPVVGPNQLAAQLESSKSFAKNFMVQQGIPTAKFRVFTVDQQADLKTYLAQHVYPVVIKADGLAAGKGVIICNDFDQAFSESTNLLSGFTAGDSGKTLVIEEFLQGIEVSVFALINGANYYLLPSAKDYKRIGEADTGKNTGGMGSVSPVLFAQGEFLTRVIDTILEPTIQGLIEQNMPYQGFIFLGLMNSNGNPYLIEYNVRLGDPETQSILPLIEEDFLELLIQTAGEGLKTGCCKSSNKTAVTIVCASKGYPDGYKIGFEINGLEQHNEVTVFHAGTVKQINAVCTSGGRVLAVTAVDDNLELAIANALAAAEAINFEGKYYRKDIGSDLMAYSQIF